MSLPKHLAIIMDGNGRWARQRSRPRTYGHIKGARVAKEIITSCVEQKIEHLTLYAFSSENWLRPAAEVSFLMGLLQRYLRKEIQKLMAQNIQFRVIGELDKIPAEVLAVVKDTVEATRNNTGLKLTFAISYGSRQEMVEAFKKISHKIQSNELKLEDVTEEFVNSQLSTAPYPDPDFIIRTSGEHRLSNFLLWQAAYSEFYFCQTLWPDFDRKELDLALNSYRQRERRFGAVTVNEQTTHH